MTNLARLLTSRSESRSQSNWFEGGLDDLLGYFTHNGLSYPLHQTMGASADPNAEKAAGDFTLMVESIYKRNGVVAAAMFVRMAVFSEARFKFRSLADDSPGRLFGNPSLKLLEKPWPNGDTTQLLSRYLNDADLAGNGFVAKRQPNPRRQPRLRRLRPDWTTIIMGFPEEVSAEEIDLYDLQDDLDGEVIGYAYTRGGVGSGNKPTFLLASEVAHFAPIPDPLASYRGMSWLVPVLREVNADLLATTHKSKFFQNAASPNLVVKLDINDITKFNEWVEAFEGEYKGVRNAYKTLFLGAGAEPTIIGNSFREMDFKNTIGAGEARIAMASGVPATILGTSEGMQGSSLNAGNFTQVRRRFADITMRPLWRQACGSLEHLVDTPEDAQLWYDDRDIPFLQEDEMDEANIRSKDAHTIRSLTDGGYEPESVVEAIVANDMKLLKHSGNLSVQLQPADPKKQSTEQNSNAALGRALAQVIAPYLPAPPPENDAIVEN